MSDPAVRPAVRVPFRAPTGDDLVTAVLTGDAAVRPLRAMFRGSVPQEHVRSLLVQALDPLLLSAVLGADLARRWVPLLERYYTQARRRSPATFLDFDRVWADQRRRWQPLADTDAAAGAAQETAIAPDTALDVPGRGAVASVPTRSRRRRAPGSDAAPARRPAAATGGPLSPIAADALAAAYASYEELLDVFDPWEPDAWSGLRVGSRSLARGSPPRPR